MKRITIAALISIVFIALSVPSATAGSKQRHRWEGVAIGVGATILGSAIISSHHYPNRVCRERVYHRRRPVREVYYYPAPTYSVPVYTAPPPVQYSPPPSQRPSRGHWQVREVWISPVYEKVWNQAHFNSRNEWVKGEWIRIEKEPGYWSRERVWVSNR